jgi:hypothetical protein
LILFLRIEFDMYRTLKKEFDMYVNVMYYVHASILVHTKVPSVATLGEYVHAWTGEKTQHAAGDGHDIRFKLLP